MNASSSAQKPAGKTVGTVRILGFTYATGPKVTTTHLVILSSIDWMMRILLGREAPAPAPTLENKVLAIAKIDLLGDVLMITPLLRELRVQAPSTKLLLIVGSWSVGAGRLILDEGLCDSLVIYDPPTMSPVRSSWPRKFQQWLRTLRSARAELREQKADIYLELRSSSPDSLLLARLTGIRHKIGYGLRGYSYLLQQALPYDAEMPMGQQYLNALDILGLTSAKYEKPLLEWQGTPEPMPATISPSPEYVILHPFSRNPRKMIPATWWAKLLTASTAGRRVLVVGTQSDLENAELAAVLSSAGCDFSAVGRTTFRQAVACVRQASAFIGVDSVFAHVALAFDKPTFVAGIRGASFRPAFPLANENLCYHEMNLDSSALDLSAPALRAYCELVANAPRVSSEV